jgi:protein TonB
MKKILLILITILLVGNGLMAQSNSSDTSQNDEHDVVFKTIQIEAEFPGGLAGWRKYLEENLNTRLGGKYIKIPKGETEARATVTVDFLVDKKGNIFDVSADSLSIATVHKKIVAEAVRVIKEGPKWKPAMQDGKYVLYRQRQAITFVATKD